MNGKILSLLAAALLTGCATVRGDPLNPPAPALYLNNHRLNRAIINPTPPRYGNGMPGGCIPEDEFRVDVDSVARDTATGRLRIPGRVGNANGSKPPQFLFATLAVRKGGSETPLGVTGERGAFSVEVAAGDTLVVRMLGFRTLLIDPARLVPRR